jgi:hypothetical protein
VATASPVRALPALSAPPLGAVLGWRAVSPSSGGRLQPQFADAAGGEQQAGDLAAGAHGCGVPSAGDVGTGFDQTT